MAYDAQRHSGHFSFLLRVGRSSCGHHFGEPRSACFVADVFGVIRQRRFRCQSFLAEEHLARNSWNGGGRPGPSRRILGGASRGDKAFQPEQKCSKQRDSV
eukprot:12749108-Ditylum_brightwellii.AAC.1